MSSLAEYYDLVCLIQMIWSREEKVLIRIEKGTKPRLKTDENGNIRVCVPQNTFVNWPTVKEELPGGYNITIQRLQQQFKITVQHNYERKPEIVIYSSCLAHENDIKIQVKEITTQIPQISIAGPNMDVVGSLKASRLTLESTVGTMHVNAKIQCDRLALHAQSIVVATETLISTQKYRAICRKMQLDGKIFPSEVDGALCAAIESNLVHLGVDGSIGESNEKENLKTPKGQRSQLIQITASSLSLRISGSLANYGRIVAKDRIDFFVGDNVLSLSDGVLDSAGRGYSALKQIRGIQSTDHCAPSSSSLHDAINQQNASAAAHLLESGVDLNDKGRNKRLSLRQTAIMKYREKREESKLNKVRENITLINALISVHDWRRGSIAAQVIRATVDGNCDDCAQFTAKELQMKINGRAQVERDSIWSSTWVEVDVGNNVTIDGQVKLGSLLLTSGGSFKASNDAIVSSEMFARITCKGLHSDAIWSIGENLVIDSDGDAVFRENSYVESEKMEIAVSKAAIFDGSFQLASLWCQVTGSLTIQPAGKMFIEENASILCNVLTCHGFLNITEICDIQVKNSAQFTQSSKLETFGLKFVAQENCNIEGTWIVDNMTVYVRNELSTPSGKIAVFNTANVTAGTFSNSTLWQIEKDCSMILGSIEQADEGILFTKHNLDMVIHCNADHSWAGRMVCSKLQLSCLKSCAYDGFLRANSVEVQLPYSGESKLVASGQWDVLCGPLTLKGNSVFYPAAPRKAHSYPAFVLKGKLSASAIVSPFIAVELGEGAIARLTGIQSPHDETSFSILVSAGALTTRKTSAIISLAKDLKEEGIIVGASWYHEGQIRFIAEEVHLLVNSWVNKGRVTNVEEKQNHVRKCHVIVEELFLNKGTLACDHLRIAGDGTLDNRNRLFAVHHMDIRLSNFHNDEGLMESKNSMHLLSASKEWTKLGGAIKAKNGLDLCASKLELGIKDATALSKDDRLHFSAKSDLILTSDISDENRHLALGCAAQNSVTIDALIEIDRLEVLLGAAHSQKVMFMLNNRADMVLNTLVLNGSAEELQILIDGSIRCTRVKIAEGFKRVTFGGRGCIEINTIQAEKNAIDFDLYQIVTIGDIAARSVTVRKESMLRLQAPQEIASTSITSERIHIEGTVFVENKLFLGACVGCDLSVSGPIVGSGPNSELSIEASRVRIGAQLANFKFLELYAKEYCSIEKAKLKNIAGIAMDCAEVHINADLESCDNVVLNCENAVLKGTCTSQTGKAVFSVFSTNATCSMDFDKMEKVSIGCRLNSTIEKSFSNVQNVDLDCKWLTSAAHFRNCCTVSATAWSVLLRGAPMDILEHLNVVSLGVILLESEIRCPSVRLVAPFVMSPSVLLHSSTEVHSLAYIGRFSEKETRGVSYLTLSFDESLPSTSKLNPTESASWKETAALMKDRFSCQTIDVDEMLLGLKYLSDLTPTRIQLNSKSAFCEDISRICSKFSTNCISQFNTSELVATVYHARQQFPAGTTNNEKTSSGKKRNKKREECLLYECLSQFRSTKYSKERAGASDSDGGYASRSSSEDLDSKDGKRTPLSPTSPCSPLFNSGHLEELERRLDQVEVMETTMEEVNASLVEEEELAEFEELEREIEDAENGLVRTDYIVHNNYRIELARLKQKTSCAVTSRPRPQFPIQRVPSSNDLVMKRFKVKSALSTMDLRSFGSESSLLSLDFSTHGDIGCPMEFPVSPFQRSRIPRSSFRSPRKAGLV